MAAQSTFLCVLLTILFKFRRPARPCWAACLAEIVASSCARSTSRAFAVVGASTDRSKFGNKILRWYIDHGLGDSTVPVNPKDAQIESLNAVKSLDDLPDSPQRSISIITPPKVTLGVLQAAASKREDWRYWCQPCVACTRDGR